MYSYPIGKRRACVKVKKIKKGKNYFLEVQDGIHAIGSRTEVHDLPKNIKVVDKNGQELRPTGRFVLTSETIDPYHLLADMW